jgi:hypothetical protein
LGVSLENVDDTTSDAKFIDTHNHMDTRVIASAWVVKIYDLDIFLNGIHDIFAILLTSYCYRRIQ